MLFSATQTKKISDLRKLSLNKNNTEYVAVHQKEIMPKKLQQFYVVCEIYEKIDILFSFVKTHIKSKIIVFLSTSKQVAFLSQVFEKLSVGTHICKLSGDLSQNSRRENYEKFISK
jgi:ATP-dependent RNA helicase DDX10/DBP4